MERRFCYDGVRRIQEVVTDQTQNLAVMMSSGQQAAAATVTIEEEVDTDGQSVVSENDQLVAADSSTGGDSTTGTSNTYLDREYIWSPGDNGVDELFVQFDRTRKPWWILQDTGGMWLRSANRRW